MRILADENVPLASVLILREAGHDVRGVGESDCGSTDLAVLQIAASESRFVVTFDRDFGRLVFRGTVPLPTGVVLMRFAPTTAGEAADVLMGLLARPEVVLEGRFTVVDRERVRQRPFPQRP